MTYEYNKEYIKNYYKKRYEEDDEFKKKERERMRNAYKKNMENPEYAEKRKEYQRKKWIEKKEVAKIASVKDSLKRLSEINNNFTQNNSIEYNEIKQISKILTKIC